MGMAASEYKKYRGHLTYPSLMPNQRMPLYFIVIQRNWPSWLTFLTELNGANGKSSVSATSYSGSLSAAGCLGSFTWAVCGLALSYLLCLSSGHGEGKGSHSCNCWLIRVKALREKSWKSSFFMCLAPWYVIWFSSRPSGQRRPSGKEH